ncbi:Uu.00g023530.m01.CDS01 [Anthostomella pinea]|uniref:Uu.00g023530.m01.CDS01 n=1 Tax=Anthostomella pinea TaxID=933095 RepID=A0AAI8W0Q4_9PEZI|nr:Uu.00g023530.m01.CDS01 [Anthostomella pinea]
MTEKLPSLLTQTLTPSQKAVFSPNTTPAHLHHGPSKPQAPVEEEPYTIKCICDFTDDDGNTIYCEICDSWQHIECYYPYNVEEALREDFAHSCVDCKPRPLDRQRAMERQQRLRQNRVHPTEVPERKTKRPLPKGQKKKTTKPNDLALNGHSSSDSNTKQPHESAPAHQHKKSKSSHRPSQSISAHNPKQSPSYGQKMGNPHGHPPSPANTPPDVPYEIEIHNYSSGFLNLYKEDHNVAIVQSNSFANLIISNVLSLWLRDRDKLRRDADCEFADVFQSLPSNIDSIKAVPEVEFKKLQVGPETVVHYRHLTTRNAIDKDTPLIELNGQIGIQKNYCEDPNNHWQDVSSPLPFVFFHPVLPIYIDTRKEGSLARYVRRSCKPNAELATFLSDGSEYHFWLVSDRRIAPHEQITIPWTFRLQKDVGPQWHQLLGLSDESDAQPEYNDREIETYQSIASWVHTILSEYGGCGCDLGPECAFARFHRTYIVRSHAKERNPKQKRSRKQKANTSPTSTGHATNSRAPSEGHAEDGLDNDSGSSRSKPPSRDETPGTGRQGSLDTLGILTQPTDRDKRKVQMVEDSFRRMEQQPPRKKKRTSDGTNSSSTTTKSKSNAPDGSERQKHSSHGGNPTGVSDRRYVNAGTTASVSISPTSAISPNPANPFKKQGPPEFVPIPSRHSSQGPRPEYCDAAVQTDPVDGEWFTNSRQSPKPRRRVVSLSKRLLESRHRLRAEEEQRRRTLTASPSSVATSVATALVKMDLDSPTTDSLSPNAATPKPGMEAAEMFTTAQPVDAPMSEGPSISPTANKVSPVALLSVAGGAKIKSPELLVQLPPVPAFNSSTSATSTTTPLSASGNLVQSPFSANNLPSPFVPGPVSGAAVHPSPVKKKLSLSDYTRSRMNKAAAAKPATSLKPPVAIMEEAKSPTNPDAMILDSPVVDKTPES